jgi:hypothetical protein
MSAAVVLAIATGGPSARCKRRRISVEDIAEEYGVSETSVRFILRVTEAEAQPSPLQSVPMTMGNDWTGVFEWRES